MTGNADQEVKMTDTAGQNEGLSLGIRVKCFLKELCEVERELSDLYDKHLIAELDRAWKEEQISWKRKKKKQLLLLLRSDLNKLADSYMP